VADRRTAIRASQLRNFSVTAEDLKNGSITGNKFIDGTISGSKIANEVITEVHLDIGNAPVNNYFLQYTTASGLIWAEPSSDGVASIDGGSASSVYGGVGVSLDGGNASSSF